MDAELGETGEDCGGACAICIFNAVQGAEPIFSFLILLGSPIFYFVSLVARIFMLGS